MLASFAARDILWFVWSSRRPRGTKGHPLCVVASSLSCSFSAVSSSVLSLIPLYPSLRNPFYRQRLSFLRRGKMCSCTFGTTGATPKPHIISVWVRTVEYPSWTMSTPWGNHEQPQIARWLKLSTIKLPDYKQLDLFTFSLGSLAL